MRRKKDDIIELDVDSIGSQTPLTEEEKLLISEHIKKLRELRKKEKSSNKEVA